MAKDYTWTIFMKLAKEKKLQNYKGTKGCWLWKVTCQYPRGQNLLQFIHPTSIGHVGPLNRFQLLYPTFTSRAEPLTISNHASGLEIAINYIHAKTIFFMLGILSHKPRLLIKTIMHDQSATTLMIEWNNPPRTTKVF